MPQVQYAMVTAESPKSLLDELQGAAGQGFMLCGGPLVWGAPSMGRTLTEIGTNEATYPQFVAFVARAVQAIEVPSTELLRPVGR
jgi:hypothetical protein